MKWKEEVQHTTMNLVLKIRPLGKMKKSAATRNAWGLQLSSRPTILVFGSINFEFVWESYDQNTKTKNLKNSAEFFQSVLQNLQMFGGKENHI